MRARLVSVLVALVASCGGSSGGGGGGSAFIGLWQYRQGSFSFVNCFTASQENDLTRTGFQIVNEAGNLVRISLDGCRLKIVQTTATHASGVADQGCTVSVTDALGNRLTTSYRLKTLVMELKPDDASQMVEVFDLNATLTSTLGTVACEISGNNTLNRAP